MSLPPVTAVDPGLQRILAGELAKSLWASAKPAAGTDETGDAGGGSSATAADTYASLFTDVLADAIAGTPAGTRKSTPSPGPAAR
jgi:hypothetical protein